MFSFREVDTSISSSLLSSFVSQRSNPGNTDPPVTGRRDTWLQGEGLETEKPERDTSARPPASCRPPRSAASMNRQEHCEF